MKIQIKCRFSARVLFETEADSMKLAVEAAVKADAYLACAYLAGAYLARADLARADLARAYLAGAKNLTEEQLISIRDDIWAVLSSAPREAAAVRDALIAGKVNGSAYEGKCACLVGTIANARRCNYNELGSLKPNSDRPAERWFMAIKPGDTPENSVPANFAAKWIGEWMENMSGAFALNEA